jgi:hypothetical protein
VRRSAALLLAAQRRRQRDDRLGEPPYDDRPRVGAAQVRVDGAVVERVGDDDQARPAGRRERPCRRAGHDDVVALVGERDPQPGALGGRRAGDEHAHAAAPTR